MLGPLLTKATPQQPAITHSTAGLSFPWKGMEIAFIFQEQRDQLTPTSPVSSHPCPVPASIWLHKDLETLWRPGEWKANRAKQEGWDFIPHLRTIAIDSLPSSTQGRRTLGVAGKVRAGVPRSPGEKEMLELRKCKLEQDLC